MYSFFALYIYIKKLQILSVSEGESHISKDIYLNIFKLSKSYLQFLRSILYTGWKIFNISHSKFQYNLQCTHSFFSTWFSTWLSTWFSSWFSTWISARLLSIKEEHDGEKGNFCKTTLA